MILYSIAASGRIADVVSEAGSGGVDLTTNTGIGPPSDQEKLLAFIRSLRHLIRVALERPALFEPYGDLLLVAAQELPRRFDEVTKAIERLSSDGEELKDHGLTGDELDLKLQVYYDAQERFLEALDRLDRGTLRTGLTGHPAPLVELRHDLGDTREAVPVEVNRKPEPLLRRAFGASLRTLRKMARHPFEMGDLILGSVGSSVPGAGLVTGAIGEIKGTMEVILRRK